MKEYRMKILKETYRTLKQGGVLLMAQGIKEQAGFWHSPGEIVNDLLGIGFTEVIVYPTTDPYDHKEENGKLVPIEGLNFIIVAKK